MVTGWDFPGAIAEYYSSQDRQDSASQGDASAEPDFPRGPRTLGGAPASASAPNTSAPSSAANKSKAPKKFATLGNFGGGEPHPHSDDDSDEDYIDDDEDKKQDLYAGGEKSGLALQNPSDPRSGRAKNLAEKLVKKATE